MKDNPKRLSSHLTFAYKVLLPLSYGGFLVYLSFQVKPLIVQPGVWGPLLALIAIGWLIWTALVPLKRVRMDEGGLLVSNYLTEIIVPFANIKEVSGHRDRLQRITVIFHRETEFGDNIVFMARLRSIFGYSSESIAKEIRAAASSAIGKSPGAAA